jgi:hypothetical protein
MAATIGWFGWFLAGPAAATAATVAQAPTQGAVFKDISKAAGLDFIHFNGMTGNYYFPEMTGQGGGFLDYDNDGDLDVYLLQGALLGPKDTMADTVFPPRDPRPRDRLYRNDSRRIANDQTEIRFVDVTDKAGLNMTRWGMGLAAADFNNDGWTDIYVTNVGPNQMLYNNGDGTFSDVTNQTGTGDPQWGASAAAFDYDRDGWLDLYVTNYVDFDLVKNAVCYAPNSRRDYCGPSAFKPQRDRLYHNRGDGTFEDVTAKALVDYQAGSGLGVVAIDANLDGWLDIYVANDGRPNQLWLNQKGKFFEDDALFAGVAVNQDGQAEGSMGVAMGDFDNDGDEDILITHIMRETNTLYLNDGSGLFEDRTSAYGLAASSFRYTAFGTGWIDFDNDGWLDLLLVNGAVLVIEELALAGDPYPLGLPNQLFKNMSGKRFTEVRHFTAAQPPRSEVSRGAAFGDIDNDGDLDILINNNNAHVRLLQNLTGQASPWLGLRLVDANAKRDQLGALVALKRTGAPTIWRRVRTDGSYCTTNDPRLHFGLGANPRIDAIRITWPDGSREQLNHPPVNRYLVLTKGRVAKEVFQP